MCLWEFSQREDSHLNLEKKKGSCIVSLMNWMTGLFHLTYGHEAVKTVCLTSGTSLQSQRQQKGNWLWRREQIVEAAAGWGRASCSVIKASEHDPVPGNTPANLQTSFKEQSRPKILRRSTGLGKKQKKTDRAERWVYRHLCGFQPSWSGRPLVTKLTLSLL